MPEEQVPLRQHLAELREADQRALDAAFAAAKEKSASHNDIIQAMERQQATFVTKGQVYAALIAMLTVAAVVISIFAVFWRG